MSDEAFNDALVADFDKYHEPETAATILKRGLEMKRTGVSISGGDPHMRINAAAATA
jgi:organic radical activating enzyme